MQIHTATCPTCPCVYRWEWSIKFGEGQFYWWCPILVESRSNRRLLLGWIINHLVMLESNIGIITTSRFYNLNTQCRLPSFIELNLYIKLIHFACIEVAAPQDVTCHIVNSNAGKMDQTWSSQSLWLKRTLAVKGEDYTSVYI